MTNHPNLSKKNRTRASSPTAAEVRAARVAAGLTPTQSAELIYCTLSSWQQWEGESKQGNRPMPAAAFELFLLKTGQVTLDEIIGGNA